VISITILSSAVVLVGQSGNDPDEVLMQNNDLLFCGLRWEHSSSLAAPPQMPQLEAAYAQVKVETDRAAG
jgi:hypothetical protein